MSPRSALSSLFVLGLASSALAIGTPFGQGSSATGGGDAEAATPSSNEELTEWLADDTARVILLDSIFDFTEDEGTTSATGCLPWTCTPNPQIAIDSGDWCSREQPDAETTDVTYYVAATNPLTVGSNKTLLGSGTSAGLKGKGLKIAGGDNIIIQNIAITDLNAQYVWGGDAITIDGGSNIWIDHNYVKNVGRQMIVTGYGAVTGTTVSNNVFDGQSEWSAVCNGEHYWTALLTGDGDEITFALNHLYQTSGRGPHVGGVDGYSQSVHIYNNYFNSIDGHAIDAQTGSNVLAEGNYFNAVSEPSLDGDGGATFAPTADTDAASCADTLGRDCVVNVLGSDSGTLYGSDTGAISSFSDSAFGGADVMAASEVPDYVQNNAGVGIVN